MYAPTYYVALDRALNPSVLIGPYGSLAEANLAMSDAPIVRDILSEDGLDVWVMPNAPIDSEDWDQVEVDEFDDYYYGEASVSIAA